jgi:hypothetical protein
VGTRWLPCSTPGTSLLLRSTMDKSEPEVGVVEHNNAVCILVLFQYIELETL